MAGKHKRANTNRKNKFKAHPPIAERNKANKIKKIVKKFKNPEKYEIVDNQIKKKG